jgi:hypothetical protein
MLQVRARFLVRAPCEAAVRTPFVSAHPPRSSPCPDDDPALYGAAAAAQQVPGSRRRRRALGRARGRARPNPAGCGEVTSPLFSITSILNATSYYFLSRKPSPLLKPVILARNSSGGKTSITLKSILSSPPGLRKMTLGIPRTL